MKNGGRKSCDTLPEHFAISLYCLTSSQRFEILYMVCDFLNVLRFSHRFEIFSTFWDSLNLLRVFKHFEIISMFSLRFSLRFEIPSLMFALFFNFAFGKKSQAIFLILLEYYIFLSGESHHHFLSIFTIPGHPNHLLTTFHCLINLSSSDFPYPVNAIPPNFFFSYLVGADVKISSVFFNG